MTGPGGVGKTRLALDIGARLADAFPDGIWLVRLESIRDVELVLATIAQAVGIADASAEDLADSLAAWLGPGRHLFLIDNFEQVAEASPVLGRLLETCPGLKMMVTSRTSLGVPGEHEFPLNPLPMPGRRAVPTVSGALEYPAVRLFVDRAKEVAPSFTLNETNVADVLAICGRLDGLPLAIELAAARIRVLTPAALLERLSDRLRILRGGSRALPERQKTMRDAIAWSYDLLDDRLKTVFRSLGVFAGGFTLPALEALFASDGDDGEIDPFDLLDYLTDLVDQSLVRRIDSDGDDPRFDLFQTVHEFAISELDAEGEERARRLAHAEWVIALVESAEEQMVGRDQVAWFKRLETEHDNIRGALSFAIGIGDGMLALRIPARLWRFWWLRGHLIEGRRWLRQVIAMHDGATNSPYAYCLLGAGSLAEDQGDLEEAVNYYQHARRLAVELGDKRLEGRAYNSLGTSAADSGHYDEALQFYREARVRFEAVGDERGIAGCDANSASVSFYRGDYERAAEGYLAGREALLRIGDIRGAVMLLGNAGAAYHDLKRYEESRNVHVMVAEEFRSLGDEVGLGTALSNIGSNSVHLGEYELAESTCREALEIFERIGIPRMAGFVRGTLGQASRETGDLRASADWFASALHLMWNASDVAASVSIIASLAELAVQIGEYGLASELYGARSALISANDIPVSEESREIAKEYRTIIEQNIGSDAASAAFAQGEGLATELIPGLADQLLEIARAIPDDPVEAALLAKTGLTSTDLRILRLFVAGKTNAEIAAEIRTETAVVIARIGQLYAKTGTDSRAELTAYAFKQGLT
jgi:predicted ATPase/DNA-binding CsgD family transcriptional regulator